MENKELNLAELLKDHIGEEFYSLCYGWVTVKKIAVNENISVSDKFSNRHTLTSKGTHPSGDECMLFPSRDQRDWEKWAEENKKVTYGDVWDYLFQERTHTMTPLLYVTSAKSSDKLSAISKLMNVQKYLEKGWQPDWNNFQQGKYYITLDNEDDCLRVELLSFTQDMSVYFSSESNAKKAIEILGEETIRTAFSTDW